jgi:mannose-6-phosphate isomerase-like protein (cupin superfamily)
VAHRHASIDDMGGDVFRKIRRELGVNAFGANALVLPPGTEWFNHFHEEQDELYFVHRGTAGFLVDGEEFELGPGGCCYVESTTPRQFWNAGGEDLVILAIGGKGGYVERDGQMVDQADVERRKAVAAGDLSVIRRR